MSIFQESKSPLLNGQVNGAGVASSNGKLSVKDKFFVLLNSVPSAIIYVDDKQKMQFANEGFEKVFGVPSSQIIGTPVLDFLGQDAYFTVKEYRDKALAGQMAQGEIEITFKDITMFIDITYIPDKDDNGHINGYMVLINDITEKKKVEKELERKQKDLEEYVNSQKQMEEKIRENEIRYQTLLENIPEAIYTCDAKGYITLFNKAASALWGREPVPGKDMWCGSWKIFEPDGITPVELDTCPMAIAIKEGRTITGKEIIIEKPDGERRHVQPCPRPLFDSSGKITGAVNMLLDITDRKESVKKLAHLAAIVHSSMDPIISKTLSGIVTSWNDAAEKLFGYTAHEMIGQPITKLIPEDRLNEEIHIQEKLKKGEMIEHFETKRMTKDKKMLDISLTVSPLKDENGSIIGASKIARDITVQKTLYETLKESEERLRMASEATNLGTWEFHPANKKLIWSEKCKNIYGVQDDFEPDSEFVSQHIHPDDREYVHNEVLKAMDPANLKTFQIFYRIFRYNDNEIRWLKVQGKVYFNLENKAERFIGTMLDITEEKQLEELEQKARESEERFRMAIEATRLGTWEFFPLTKKLSWSVECRKIYDVPMDMEIDYQFFSDYIHPDDAGHVQQKISEAMDPEGQGRYDIQYRIIRYSDNKTRWIRAQGRVYFNVMKEAERFIGTILDITDEKIRELELKSSVELFTTMADNVPAMIWMSGDDKFSDFFNKTWLQFTGRTLEEESNERWLENVHPDDVQKCVDGYNQAFNEQKGHYVEYRLRRHDGQYRWIADNSVPRYNRDETFAGFISACIDIDDQKNAREKIMESELRLKTISNASPVGLWMTDTNAQNTFVNDTWIEWTGIPFEKQLGTGWLATVMEEDKINAPSAFWECLLKKEKYSTEFRIIKPDGEMRWCLTEGAPYYNIDGEFAGYAGSVTDITDIRKMEERKDDFIKMASHELKTPITSIKGYVQLLLNIYDELNEEKFQSARPIVKSSLQTISKQVSKLTRLISELLDLSRIESGKLELHKTEFDLSDLIEETVQDVRHTTSSHAIIVHNDFEGNIYGDKDRISQVLLNLLTNAIKYSPDADNVEIFAEGNKKRFIIRVKDYGIGIDKKDHEKIFQRFYRVEGKSEQTYPGFGIGLFIANEIVQRHDGTIAVQSKKDQGSVFTVTMPVGMEK